MASTGQVDGRVACPGCRLAWLKIRQLNLNWQHTVANGCLNRVARSDGLFPAGLSGAPNSGIADAGVRDAKGEINCEIAKV